MVCGVGIPFRVVENGLGAVNKDLAFGRANADVISDHESGSAQIVDDEGVEGEAFVGS